MDAITEFTTPQFLTTTNNDWYGSFFVGLLPLNKGDYIVKLHGNLFLFRKDIFETGFVGVSLLEVN